LSHDNIWATLSLECVDFNHNLLISFLVPSFGVFENFALALSEFLRLTHSATVKMTQNRRNANRRLVNKRAHHSFSRSSTASPKTPKLEPPHPADALLRGPRGFSSVARLTPLAHAPADISLSRKNRLHELSR
jgi:hypothetical protein